MNKLIFIFILMPAGVFISSCTKKDDDTAPASVNYTEIISNTAENVILKTYEDLENKTAALLRSTQTLESSQTQANLEAARTAWTVARSPWEQSEGFLFGPVDQEGLDPSIDSWPVNVTDLNNVLKSNNRLTVDFLAQQEGVLKGFHTIEYLLWGINGQKKTAEFTAREFEYLAAASGVLAADAKKLYGLWKPGGGNFIANMLNAGKGSKLYISQKAALEAVTAGLLTIADEVATGKINTPFEKRDVKQEESHFSSNSKADFADNIRSVKNIYTGRYGQFGTGKSVSAIISLKKSELHATMLRQIDAAISAIENIPGTFSDAITNNRDAVSKALSAVTDLKDTLEKEVQPIISDL